MNTENESLFTEALLDLVIIIKKNMDLINENTELRKRIEEENKNDIRKDKFKKGNSH